MKKIAQGAEAIIMLDKGIVIKNRTRKCYRNKELDDEIRKSRTRHEAKIIEKLSDIAPKIIEVDEKESTIRIEYIDGDKLRDIFSLKHCKDIAKNIAYMHDKGMIHGDLTTSNMIVKGKKLYFIDFGLSYFSHKVEDKAVDLHLLRQALESKHYDIWEKAFASVLKEYEKISKDGKDVIGRLKIVEERGRNKHK